MLRLPARAALLANAALTVVPAAASAKVFSAHFTDPAGDAKSSGFDITAARVAYNRRTGALSGAVTVAGSIDAGSNTTVAIGLSDLVNGKCYQPLLMVGGVFSHPTTSFGERINAKGGAGKLYLGTASQSDDTMSFRVRNKKLSGNTVGCAIAMVMTAPTDGSKPKILDETAANNGFN